MMGSRDSPKWEVGKPIQELRVPLPEARSLDGGIPEIPFQESQWWEAEVLMGIHLITLCVYYIHIK